LAFAFFSVISKCFVRLIGSKRTVLHVVQVRRRVIFFVVLACAHKGRPAENSARAAHSQPEPAPAHNSSSPPP